MKSHLISFIVFVLVLLNTGCAVYKARKPVIEGHFPGISKDVADSNIKDIRIFIIHGIGRQKLTYSQEFIGKLTDQLSNKHKNKQLLYFDTIDFGDDKGKVLINRYRINEKYVTFYSLYWSEITEKYKAFIDKNHDELYDQFGVKRAKVNDKIKKMVTNDGFVDFILYASNSFKDEIREPVVKTLDLIYSEGDTIETYLKKGEFKTMRAVPVYDKSVYLITGSLGSKIVLDVLSEYGPESEPVETRNFKIQRQKFYYEKLKSIYMLTNQVPLLSLLYAVNESATADSMRYIYQNYYGLCNYLKRAENSKLNYISFYDPNDLLGYNPVCNAPVCQGKDPCTDCDQRINRVRIVLRNARPFKFMFARPDKAHVGVWENKRLIKVITAGAE